MIKQKRILFICGAAYVSGLEIITLTLMQGLKGKGHEVYCLVSDWSDSDFKNRLKEAGISFTGIKLGFFFLQKLIWTLDTLVNLPYAWYKFSKVKKEFKPTFIYHISYRTILTLYPFLNASKGIYNLQEPHLPSFKNRIIYSLINKKIETFTAPSEFIKTKLLHLGIPGEKIQVILNGVAIGNSRTKLPPLETADSGERIRIGIVGQIGPWKGHEDLIDALHIVSKSHPNFVCKIFGKGSNQFIELIKGKISQYGLGQQVEWKGFVKDQDEMYDQLDIVVIPSRSEEPCSLTIIESLMRAKPVIVTRRGGSPELVLDGETGFIVEMKDPTSLANKLDFLIKSVQARLDISRNAFGYAKKHLSDSIMIDTFEKLLN